MNRRSVPTSLREPQKAFVRLLQENCHRHQVHDVFRDFCEMAAISFSNALDRGHFANREARYMQIVARYTPEEAARFPKMLGQLAIALESPHDCLGQIFMALELGNHWRGQFFTPYELALLMARMTCTNAVELVKEKGYISVMEPAAGAGGMLIAMAETLQGQGLSYQRHMHATAIDVDSTAVHMTYVQLSLMHIPAIVLHGNALANDRQFDAWATPAHIVGGWDRRMNAAELADAACEAARAQVDPAPARGPVYPSDSQLALF